MFGKKTNGKPAKKVTPAAKKKVKKESVNLDVEVEEVPDEEQSSVGDGGLVVVRPLPASVEEIGPGEDESGPGPEQFGHGC